MALNPLRGSLGALGIRAAENGSAFQPEAEAALGLFRSRKDELKAAVQRGELTPKVARRLAAEAAAEVQKTLASRADGFSSVPRAFQDRLSEAVANRKRAQESASLEALQRETNQLLRTSLIEQQLQNRDAEFRNQTYTRRVAGSEPSPTLDGLLRFHDSATMAGDEAAREWARRQLEGLRSMAPDPDDQRRIDLACDRPDRVNPALVSRYVEQLDGSSDEELEHFARESVEARDANACVAAFILARQAPEGAARGWVRQVLQGVELFPDSALTTLRTLQAEARADESAAAMAEVDRVAMIAEAEAAMPALKPPTEAELERMSRVESLPLIAPGEAIGLVPGRRGFSAEEFANIEPSSEDSSENETSNEFE